MAGMTPIHTGLRSTTLIALLAITALSAPQAEAQLNQTQHYDGWILAAAHAPGFEGSIWRTDPWFVIENSGSGPVTLKFCRSNTDNTGAAEYIVDIPQEKKMFYIEDVVDNATNDAFFVRGVKRMKPDE